MAYVVALSILGWTLAGFALTMLAPAFVAFGYAEIDQAWTFLVSAGVTLFAGGALVAATRGISRRPNQREAFALAVLVWSVLPFFGALPLYYVGVTPTATDAYFEAMSGLTTTGATVLAEPEAVARSVLVWRALLQWLGGLGALMLTFVLLSFYSVGAMKLFRSAMPRGERHDLRVQLAQSLQAIWWIYLALTSACALSLFLAGVGVFESVCLAMSTLSTGGFSTRGDSLASIASPAVETVLVVFMLVGAVNFTFHWALFHGRGWRAYAGDPEVRYLVAVAVAGSAALAAALLAAGHPGTFESIRAGVFHAVSMMTTTGFHYGEPVTWGEPAAWNGLATWPLFATLLLAVLALVGGCTGSTAGGLKLLRLSLLIKLVVRELNRLPHPSAVRRIVYAGRAADESPLSGILTFFCTYAVALSLIGVVLSFFGLDFHHAFMAGAAALSNTGPLAVLAEGGEGGYDALAAGAKWTLCVAMLLGRLELFALLAFLAGAFRRT